MSLPTQKATSLAPPEGNPHAALLRAVRQDITPDQYTALERALWEVKPYGWELHKTLVVTLKKRDHIAIEDHKAIEGLLREHLDMDVAVVR